MTATAWHPLARRELLEASAFYEGESPGLGEIFLAAVEETLGHLERHPQTGRKIGEETRQLSLPRFPYAVVYRPEEERLFILALAHHRRRPRYWAGRL